MGACTTKEEPYLPGRDVWTPNNTFDSMAPPQVFLLGHWHCCCNFDLLTWQEHTALCQNPGAGGIILIGDTDEWRFAAAVVPFRFSEASKKKWVHGHDWGVVYTKGNRVCIQPIRDFIRWILAVGILA